MTEPAAGPVVRAENLGMRFNGFAALESVSFTVDARSITGLVGPNGAGKTTLLRILATLLEPTSGRAIVAGHDVVRSPSRVRGLIGFLPDFPGLYQDMRVDEYLRFFADAHGLGAGDRAAFMERALELSGLKDRARSFIEELSRGMRSRLSFVRALAGNPPILLLDEPLSNLDPVARADLLELMGKIRDEGKSVLVSSHILSDLEKVCDRAIFIHGGRIIEERAGDEPAGAAYFIRLSRPPGDARAFLLNVDGIVSAEPSAGGEGHVVRLREDADPADVLRAAVESGGGVLEWKPLTASLEERLLRAAKGGGS
jgi:ABC-2 type transport system ATP-binding protein